jgi:hypothetical protein
MGWLDALKTIYPEKYRGELTKSAVQTGASNDAPSMQSGGDGSPWRYGSSKDAMRGKTTQYACADANNELEFAFPYSCGSRGQLCLRRSPKFGNDVYLSINHGQFMCASYIGCRVRVRFDGGSIITMPASAAGDGSTNLIFIRSYRTVVRSLRNSKRVIVEAAFYQEGEQQLVFDVNGLKWD